jgi:hypothetical protein
MERLQALEVRTHYPRRTGQATNVRQAALEKIVLDPKYHDVLTLVKGVRNGIVYGSKVRFPHALVYDLHLPGSAKQDS